MRFAGREHADVRSDVGGHVRHHAGLGIADHEDVEVQRFEVRETLHAPWSLSVDFVVRGEVVLDQGNLVGQTSRLEITSLQG